MSDLRQRWRTLLVDPWLPPIRAAQSYRWKDLPYDLVAGLTVTVVDLPQSMAFALIAGLDPVYGLYSAIVLSLVGALFTSSPFLSVGPTNTQCLLIASVLARYSNDPELYLRLAIGLALIKGLLQLFFFSLRLGRMVRYVSRSVMVGFTAGAGILIVAEQVPAFLGIDAPRMADMAPGVPGVLARVGLRLTEADPRAIGIGVAVIAIVWLFKRAPAYTPGPLLGVVAGAIVVWAADWAGVGAVQPIKVVGAIEGRLPPFNWPALSFTEVDHLLAGALALALLGLFESVMIAKAIGLKTGSRIDADQEFFGQGLANVVASFFSCFPGSGSFSRTALQYSVGARTRFASVFSACFNAVFFLLAAPLAFFIPHAALAGTLFVVGISIIDWKTIRRILATSRADGIICVGTLLAALVLPLTYAIYVGIGFNLLIYLGRVSRLKTSELVMTEGGGFREDPVLLTDTLPRDMLFLQFHCDLYYPLEEELTDLLEWSKKTGARVVVLNFRGKHSADTAGLYCLEHYLAMASAEGVHVMACGIRPELSALAEKFGLFVRLPVNARFETESAAYAAALQQLARIKAALPPPTSIPAPATV